HAIAYVQPHEHWRPCEKTGAAPENALVSVPAGAVTIGKNKTTHQHYGWDNEYGLHSADVAAFQASKYLVSNQEYLSFIDDRGYQTDEYWEEEGLSWRNFSKVGHPAFWIR